MKFHSQKAFRNLARLGLGLFLTASLVAAQSSSGVTKSPNGAGGRAMPNDTHGGTTSAPEIDVALAGGALALLTGGVLVVTALRRKRLARS